MSTADDHDTAHFSEFQQFSNKFFIYFAIIAEPLIIVVAVLGFQDNPQLIIVLSLAAILPVVLLLQGKNAG